MAKDSSYTNGVIAVKETSLLGDRLYKLCEGTFEEGVRTLSECGFFKNADADNIYDFEKYLREDEEETDAFIREYASRSALVYLLAPRDYHNAKAIVKARLSGADVDSMLAPDGLIPAEKIKECVSGESFEKLGDLGEPCKEVLSRSEEGLSGAEIGVIFERAKFKYLLSECKLSFHLSRFLKQKIDMQNILSAVRAEAEEVERQFIEGGTLSFNEVCKIVESEDGSNSPYKEFTSACLAAKRDGLPPVEGEKIADSFEGKYYSERRFELKASEPVIYYVLRRRAQNRNVRIALSCLAAGLNESEIKKRLREF